MHTRIEMAGCRACVDACPADAWLLDDEMLAIDSDRCDGCALCSAACMEQAIEPAWRPQVRNLGNERVAFAICQFATDNLDAAGWLPCLHAISLRTLAEMSRQGVQSLFVCDAGCGGCSRAGSPAQTLDQRMVQLNQLLLARGVQPIRLRSLDAELWHGCARAATGAGEGLCMSRRGFFRAALDAAAERSAPDPDAATTVPVAMLLPGDGRQNAGMLLYPTLPVIEPRSCSGCDACFNLCAHGALHIDQEGGTYHVDATRCTGCGICRDVCTRQAVSLIEQGWGNAQTLRLQTRRCSACGVQFHRPVADEPPQMQEAPSVALCAVCSRHNHHANLYQVMDA